ncbi:MAG: DnaJ domain-containing protein, partial [Chloroflexota bacterium]|nr:DnaJ domain-containing protein [Chloroflexota bacterium]
VVLVRQLDLSPPASRIGVSRDGRWVAVAAASRRAGNLSLYDLTDGSVVWRATLDASSARVFALDDGGCIAITQSGRVGAGNTDLHFLDARGQLRATARLDDKLTEAQVVDGAVIVGCRDGHLYTYDLRGAPAWQYRVPPDAGLELDQDDPYYRPCPYFIRAPFAGDRILFSSWDRLFMLDRSGVCRWTWRTKTEPRTLRFAVLSQPPIATSAQYRLLGVARTASADDVRRAFRKKAFETHPDRNGDDPRAGEKFKEAMRAYEAIKTAERTGSGGPRFSIGIHIASGPNAISGLAVGDDGSAIATSRDGLTLIDAAGRVTQRLTAGIGASAVHASADLRHIVYAHWQGLSFYTPDGLVKLYPTDRLYQVAVRCDGEHVIAWHGRQVLAFDGAGHLLAELEFAKQVGGVAFLADDQLLISAGKLSWIEFASRTRPGAG